MQDRLSYANGNTITTEGFRCTVGEAIYDDEVVANENGDAVLSEYGIAGFNMNSQYLVTLEVNGVSKLYRELWTSGDIDDNNSVPMGEYTFSMDDRTIMGLAEGDHVRIKIEPVTVKTTDAFRAAVKKVAPSNSSDSSGGGGGGVLVATDTNGTLDVSYQDIEDAGFAVLHTPQGVGTKVYALSAYAYTGQGAHAVFGDGLRYSAANKTDNLVSAK